MELKGINEVIANLRKYGKEAEKDIEGVTELVAKNIESYAKSQAPANFGKLGQSIKSLKINDYNWSIEAGGTIAPYAPFVEFGTGNLFVKDETNELHKIAYKFKGKGIKEVNLKPQPYLYPSLLRGRKEYLEKLKKVLDRYGKTKSK